MGTLKVCQKTQQKIVCILYKMYLSFKKSIGCIVFYTWEMEFKNCYVCRLPLDGTRDALGNASVDIQCAMCCSYI